MKAEYKLKKERWKREMDSQDTPKSQRNQGEPHVAVAWFIYVTSHVTFWLHTAYIVACI